MAPKKKSSSSPSQITIGNCEVTVEAGKFTSKSDPDCLQISLSRNAKIKIAVIKELNGPCGNNIQSPRPEGRVADEYYYVLMNPKDADSCTKSYLQEVLKIYTRELPAMKYAANTGKQSMFLERCVSNGKYRTLLLKSKSVGDSREVIAAITYQIIPADTEYAEIPLAAVSSSYQQKGIGRQLYMELRKRLHNVGVRTILCWGDRESEEFWLKQGFVSVAKVDTRGRARKLPVRADIRRALCFPGGSTLMVAHLEGISAIPLDALQSRLALKCHEKAPPLINAGVGNIHWTKSTSVDVDQSSQVEYPKSSSKSPAKQSQMISGSEESPPVGSTKDGFSTEYVSKDLVLFEDADFNKSAADVKLLASGSDANLKHSSCSAQGAKRKTWEASLSSLKSKKVKGSHVIDCQSDSNWALVSESDRNDSCLRGCSLGISRNKSSDKVTMSDHLTRSCTEKLAEESGQLNAMPEALVSKRVQLRGECFKIMLMNIADDKKKTNLTKVIEDLGGVTTLDGSMSTHVVTGKARKTLNFCTALCSGAYIVSPSWLKESFRAGRFVDEVPHILCDEDYAMKYRADLKSAVLKAKANPGALLRGYDVCIAAHAQPPAKTLSAIVRSAGGNVLGALDKVTETSTTIFVACEEDMELARFAVERGIRTFSTDWLMNCIMKQELDLEAPQFAESLF